MNAGALDEDLDGRVDDGDELGQRLRVLSEHVRVLVAERRAGDDLADDPYRGLYVSDDEAAALADEDGSRIERSRWAALPSPWPPGPGTRLAQLVRCFELRALDVDILTVAIATELEPRFEKLFGYLHDDITRRRPSVGLALELTGHGFGDAWARSRFGPESPLVRGGLLQIEDAGRPLLTRALRVPDRVVAHLLGDDRPDPDFARLLLASVVVEVDDVDPLASALRNGVTPLYVQDGVSGVGLALGASAFHRIGMDVLSVDLGALSADDDPHAATRRAIREARLRTSGLVVAVPESVSDQHPEVLRSMAEDGWPIVVVGQHPWDPNWSSAPVVAEPAPTADTEVVTQLWSSCLPSVDEVTLRDATCQPRLRPDQIVRAAAPAQRRAAGRGRPVEVSDVAMAARAQNSSKLERLARRISPTVGWDDLVLPPECLRLLHDLEIRFRRRDHVHGAWGLGGKNNRRLGVVSLFAGPSGVGKTMAAEALAGALGLDLYQVNLATVVDKYIGETEKNLERIFAAAEGVNGVILFDEADALFGKRSEVSDARDRYANVEVAYLLQRLESYEGVAVLATNLRSNIDDAFTRRLDVVVDFPEPEEDYRLVLWDRCLGRALPRDEDVDLTFLAQRFRLSGGNIRNIAVSAAFLASAHDRPVSMLDLVRSTSLEYRKLGRLCTAQEFGPWHRAVST